jgi:cytidine deaminase
MTDSREAAWVEAATKARAKALCSYSGFAVGAALEDASGRIWSGCNIENASYGLTVCAERVAIWKALSEGVR